jgi:hypothetical protein
MFGAQAVRMLRETWSNATMLAEELYAIFSDDIPLNNNAPLTLSNPNGSAAPLTIQEPGLGNEVINFTGRTGAPIGGITIVDGVPTFSGSSGSSTSSSSTVSNLASGFVAAGPDLDGNYTITLSHGNTLGGSGTVSAAPVQSGSQTIPTSTGCIVSKNKDGTFSFMVPVWL